MPNSQQLIQARWLRQALTLALVGLVWHVGETVAAWYLGVRLHSPSLRGFALDSLIELLAGIILVARIKGNHWLSEQTASRLIAISFLVIACYIIGDSLWSLFHPNQNDLWKTNSSLSLAGWAGIGLAVASLLCMYPLAWLKSRAANQLHSDAAKAEGRQTWLCAHMAWLLLLGLGFSWLGFEWADPLAALGIAGIALREAVSSWKGKDCGCAIHMHSDMQYSALLQTASLWRQYIPQRFWRIWQARWIMVGLVVYAFTAAAWSHKTILWVGAVALALFSLMSLLTVIRKRSALEDSWIQDKGY